MITKRNITYHYLIYNNQDNSQDTWRNLLNLLQHIQGLSRILRKRDIEKSEKFLLLESFALIGEDKLNLLFISARRNYRAPLIDSENLSARDNPKRLSEGEQVKTHLSLRLTMDSVLCLLESGESTLTIKQITKYLNSFIALYNRLLSEEHIIQGVFNSAIIARNDFEEILNDSSRVMSAQIKARKQLLGSAFMNFSDYTEEVSDEINIKISAKRNRNILRTISDMLRGNNSNVISMRVFCKMPDDTDSVIDTGTIVRKEFIDVDRNEITGEFDTSSMFRKLNELLDSY